MEYETLYVAELKRMFPEEADDLDTFFSELEIHHLDTLADAFWRTAKKEEIQEESPLTLTRAWICRGKLPGDDEL